MVVYYRVLAVAQVHLAHVRTQLICLCPIVFRSFTMKMADTFHVCRSKKVSAGILMSLHMEGWYSPTHLFDGIELVRKMLLESFLQVDEIFARNIVGGSFVYIVDFDFQLELEFCTWLVIAKCHSQGVIRIREPVLVGT